MTVHDLAEAIRSGSVEVVYQLLRVCAADDRRLLRNALRSACEAGRLPAVKAVYECRPDLFVADGAGSPLIWAAGAGSEALVEWLIGRSTADIDGTDIDGMTALLHAAYSQRLNVVRTLLGAGANVHHRNHEGHAALDLARMHRFSIGDDPLVGPIYGRTGAFVASPVSGLIEQHLNRNTG